MSEEIIGSKEKVTGSRGAMQIAPPSTVRAGSTLAPVPGAAPPNASADPGSWQTRGVDASPITPHPHMTGATKAALPKAGTSPRPSSVRVGK